MKKNIPPLTTIEFHVLQILSLLLKVCVKILKMFHNPGLLQFQNTLRGNIPFKPSKIQWRPVVRNVSAAINMRPPPLSSSIHKLQTLSFLLN